MEKVQLAGLYREKGCNCAQAVLCAFCSDFGLDERMALRMATGFGAGMGRMGEVCGALTGGFLVIGLKYGRTTTGGAQSAAESEKTAARVAELSRRFRERHGSILCRELTGLDLSDPAQRQRGVEEGIFHDRCGKYVRDSVEMLEQLLID